MKKGSRLLQINVLSIFPEVLDGYCNISILRRAQEKRLFKPNLINIRDFTVDKHRTVDDKPYGGGSGMVMKIEPIANALKSLKKSRKSGKIYLLSPGGRRFDHNFANELAKKRDPFTLICGRYEGIDERVEINLCDGSISIGDYILTGGELAAAVIIDAVVRLIPGVLGSDDSAINESFSDNLLDFPQYTRPELFGKWRVPNILLSGNHAQVIEWRREQQQIKTKHNRPDLLKKFH